MLSNSQLNKRIISSKNNVESSSYFRINAISLFNFINKLHYMSPSDLINPYNSKVSKLSKCFDVSVKNLKHKA